MTIWYVSRSYYPSVTGGTLIRKAQVDSFVANGFKVKVVTPCYALRPPSLDDLTISVPISRLGLKVGGLFERLGIWEDYLDLWVRQSYALLVDRVGCADIVFSTSGGELGCIKLGSLLRSTIGCKHVVNFHDPLDYSLVNGKIIDHRFHVSRERSEFKYLRDADLIITSSELNRASLQNKYPTICSKVVNNYFGYVENVAQVKKRPKGKLCIAYGGGFAELQSPHLLALAGIRLQDVELVFIGNWESYLPLAPYASTCRLVKQLAHKEYLGFMAEQVDVGFVSLTSDYLGACVPSKIYEYINLGIPLLGALPDGDGKNIINKNGYGIAVDYNDIPALRNAIELMKDPQNLERYRSAIARDRADWALKSRIKEVVNRLQSM